MKGSNSKKVGTTQKNKQNLHKLADYSLETDPCPTYADTRALVVLNSFFFSLLNKCNYD